MEREIKFRAFMAGKMHYNVGVHPFICADHTQFDKDDTMYMEEGEGDKTCFSRYDKLMQYTGLKDKNGVDIYEGDIVKDSEMTYTVKFGSHKGYTAYGWYLSHEVSDNSDALTEDDQPVIEIIGNIHETRDK